MVSTLFDPNSWIVGNGIEGLRRIAMTREEWRTIAAATNEVWRDRRVDHDPLPPDWKERVKRGISCYRKSNLKTQP